MAETVTETETKTETETETETETVTKTATETEGQTVTVTVTVTATATVTNTAAETKAANTARASGQLHSAEYQPTNVPIVHPNPRMFERLALPRFLISVDASKQRAMQRGMQGAATIPTECPASQLCSRVAASSWD